MESLLGEGVAELPCMLFRSSHRWPCRAGLPSEAGEHSYARVCYGLPAYLFWPLVSPMILPPNQTLEPTATAHLARGRLEFEFAPAAFGLALPVAVAQLFR